MKRALLITMKLSPEAYRYFIEEDNLEMAGPFETIEEARQNLALLNNQLSPQIFSQDKA